MKKTLLSIAAVFLLSTMAHAQFYMRAGLGYALPHAGQSIAGQDWPYSGSVSSTFVYQVDGASFSAGVQGNLALGYDFNKNIGVQLDAQATLSSRSYDFDIQNISVNSVVSNVTISQHAKFPVNLVPSMVVRTGGDPWNIYCRMGVALPVHSTIEKQNIITNVPGTGAIAKKIATWDIRSSFSPGFSAAAGFEYKMSSSTSLWAEVSVLSMSLYIKEAQLTKYNYSGQNIPLNQLSGTTNITYAQNIALDTVDYTRQPAYTQPFSNVGINVGIRQSFGSPKEKKSVEAEDSRRRRKY